MPGFIGRRLCPELLFVKPNFQKYTRAAAASRAVFCLFDPDFEAGSLDEAYLDITDYCRAHEITGREHLLSIPSLPNPIWITQPLNILYPVFMPLATWCPLCLCCTDCMLLYLHAQHVYSLHEVTAGKEDSSKNNKFSRLYSSCLRGA